MAAIVKFMESPLVTWVQTFRQNDPLDFQELCDGAFLNDVMLQIDPRPKEPKINRKANDTNARLQNWDTLLRSIRVYYQDILQQLIVMKLPNIVAISKQPEKESSLAEMRKVLLMILGCAVQCEKKEEYVDIIKTLDISVQQALVVYIKEITDTSENVLTVDITIALEQLDEASKNLLNTLKRLVEERDDYNESILMVTQECDYYKAERDGKALITPPPNLEKYHLIKELTESKTKLKKIAEELEERNNTISEMKEELEEKRTDLAKLRKDNLKLNSNARKARTYRDELDMLKERAIRVEKYEKEINRYKEKLSEMDFYKTRVEELRKDNSAYLESKQKVEDQLMGVQKRTETIMDELVRCQLQVDQLTSERDDDRRKIQELIEENSSLEFERSNMRSRSKILMLGSTDELASSQMSLTGSTLNIHPISEELNECANARISRLELENENLKKQLEDLQQQEEVNNQNQKIETNDKIIDLEKQLEELHTRSNVAVNKRVRQLEEEVIRLQNQSDAKANRKILDLEKRITQMQKNNNMEMSDRVKELEEEIKSLRKNEYSETNGYVSELEHTKQEHEKITNHAIQLENTNVQLGEMIQGLHDQIENERRRCGDLLQLNRDLASEKDSFKQTIDLIQQSSKSKIECLEKEVEDLSNRAIAIKTHNDKIHRICTVELETSKVMQSLSNSNGRTTPVTPVTPSQELHISTENPTASPTEKLTSTPETKVFSPSGDKFIFGRNKSSSQDGSVSDSGGQTDTESPTENGHRRTNNRTQLMGFRVLSPERVKADMQNNRHSLPKAGEKWKMLVEKIVKLQDKNQELLVDNSELKRMLISLKPDQDRMNDLERRNLQVEVENRKLRKIIESLQASLSGKPWGDKEYHYFTAV